jgi:hypothetical protein
MEFYEVPKVADETTPEEAAGLIEQLKRDMDANEGHPLVNAPHKLHEGYVEYRSQLYSRAYPSGDEAEAEEVDQQAEEHSALVEQAQEEMDRLVELGFDEAAVPDDLQEYQLRALREQRLLAEGGYGELGTMLEQDLTSLERSGSMPPGKIGAIRELIRTEGVDPALKGKVDAIANDIIALIHAGNKLKGKR